MNKYSKLDDVSDVTGMKKCDFLLQVGYRTFPFMRKYAHEVRYAEDERELFKISSNTKFDRIFVSDIDLNDHVLDRIFTMNAGLIVFFEESDAIRSKLKEKIDVFRYPYEAWDLVSNVGKCLITNAKGYEFVYSKPVTPKDLTEWVQHAKN